jgi:hypothetical protein
MKRGALCWFAVAGVIAGCASPDGSRPEEAQGSRVGALTFDLHATSYNAGRIGRATLLPQDNGTRLVLRFSGVPPYVTVPVHVYTYIYAAACGSLPSTPTWSLNDRVLVDGVSGAASLGAPTMLTISHTIPASLRDLRSGRYAIALRTAPADGNQMIFCGDIGNT